VRKSKIVAAISLALALFLVLAPAAVAKKKKKTQYIERLSAHALSMGTLATGVAGSIDIALSSWTSDEDRERLLGVLAEEGGEQLVESLREEEVVGFIRFASTRAWDLHYAREHRVEGGRIIIFATDRPIGFGEAFYNSRSLEHNLMIGRLDLPDEGNGEGSLAVGVEVKVDPETGGIKLENFSSEPLRLSHVRSRKK